MSSGTAVSGARVNRLVTSGTFSLDGGTWQVDNNVWLIGDDSRVLVIDAPHDADAVLTAVAGRECVAIVCTHAHDDHINAAVRLSALLSAPVLLHPADRALWDRVHPHRPPDAELSDNQRLGVGGLELTVVHTPGHTPGSVCLYAPELGMLFSGDTLFAGGPGATGRSFSDFPTIVGSIRTRLLTLPAATIVHPGHGADTTIGAESPDVQQWLDRGH